MVESASPPRLPVAVAIALAFILVQDTLSTLLGVQAIITILIAAALSIIGLSTVTATRSALGTRAVPLSMQLFLFWALLRFALNPSEAGVQNLLIWFIFPATIAVVYARADLATFARVYPWWKWLSVVASVVYIIEVLRDGIGAGTFPYSARGVGWVSLFALVLVVPVTATRRESWLPAAVIVTAIALSLSRTPLAIAAVLLIITFAFRPMHNERPGAARIATRLTVMTALVSIVAYVVVTRVPAIQERFTQGDGFSLGGLEINSSGRSVLWALTIEQWEHSPWTGNGPGAAQSMITALFPGWISHPHNEYLRFLDDTGVVGLTLWSLGMLALLARACRAVTRTTDVQARAAHIAAALAILTVLLGSVTDNLTVYIYCMMMAGTIVGLSSRISSGCKPKHSSTLSDRRGAFHR